MADDRAASATARGRALSALAYARRAGAHTFLENFIIKTTPSRDPGDHVLVRRAAMALGWQSGPRLTEVLAPLLDSDDARSASMRRPLWGWGVRATPSARCARASKSRPTRPSGTR